MRQRLCDYAILLTIGAILTLPNLGATSLWDVDEGVNAQAAREMYENETWIIPTFNYQLRTAKPVMLYWLQRVSYSLFGMNEWAARWPSVLAAWLTVLGVYELARRMFDRATGLLAGIVLASACEFCLLAHAATPDATLLLFTVLTYCLFWMGHENGSRRWWIPTAAACGLAMLTKGPVGVALPGLVVLLYFAWNRELGRLWDRRLVVAVLVFVLVAGPWYTLVAVETRGEWVRVFFGRENLQRFSTPMENHSGPFFYHAVALLILFTPWSVFLPAALWYGAQGSRSATGWPADTTTYARPYRFLVVWFVAYLVFFSMAATKLPNYMLPAYPAIAILTARFLIVWQRGTLAAPQWLMPAAMGGLVLTAVAVAVGLLIAGGAWPVLPPAARVFPGLERWAFLGLIPLATAGVMLWAWRSNHRQRFLQAATVGAIAFTASVAAFPPVVIDGYKAAKELVETSGVADPARDIRLAHHDWFQPSIVFYAGRQVTELPSAEAVATFLAIPTPGYLFVPERTWRQLESQVNVPTQIVAQDYDFYKNCQVLVVSNGVAFGPAIAATPR
ncbi:MAG: glycosyltransferase family 39 protein [Gemmataceae bacterium]|nr:glycosyltransferase family 39 protein [Gemmata sp.]MDW8198508.1 glycosyltransferase family 39 protein [Gemmataceae bacterium]